MAVTIKDVAREAGVSTATASRALSGKNPVSEEVRGRVLSAVEHLGYRPNALARSLRAESTSSIGLVVSNVLNPFFTSVARAVEDAAQERGYSVILGNADEEPLKEELYLDLLLQKRVDGIIVSPARAESSRLARIVEEGVPVLFVDRSLEGIEAPVVRADGRKAVEELTEHLVELGHERLSIVSGPLEVVSGRERVETFLEAAQRLGASIPEEYVKIGDFRRESGREAMRELLDLAEPPTAVFAANNLMALGALQAIQEVGCRLPENISLASFDDISWFPLMEPPITAIAQPTRELGEAAGRMLLEMVEEGKRPESFITEAELVRRGSCVALGGVK